MGVRVRDKPPGSGVWWVFINHQGRRKSKKIGRDQEQAEDVAAKIEARLVLGEFGFDTGEKPIVPKFSDYAELWLEGYGKAALKYSTVEGYQRLKPVLPRS